MRGRCRAKGPIGLVIESVYLQGARIGEALEICKYNQPVVDVQEMAYQALGDFTRQMCQRSRTTAAQGKRAETVGLKEIDEEATRAMTARWGQEDIAELNIKRHNIARHNVT